MRPFHLRTTGFIAAALLLLAGAQVHAGMVLDPYRLGTAQDLVAPYGFGDSGYAGSARVSTNQRGILLFDFASLSGPVTDASLVLYVSDRSWSSIQSRTFGLYGRGGDDGFDGLDYDLAPNSSAGSFAYSGGLLPIAVDITSFLNTFLATPDFFRCQGISHPSTCYLMLQVVWPSLHGQFEADYVTFNSAYLDITRVPEPSSLLMLITGLCALGLLGSGHRKSRSNEHWVGLMIGE